MIIWSARGLFQMKFIEVWGAEEQLLQTSPSMEEKAARDILLLGLNYYDWTIMRWCIYAENISLVHASFMEIPWTDLLAENRYLGDTRYLLCTKETKRYEALILFPSERTQNSGWRSSLPRSSKSVWDILLFYWIYMGHQKDQSRRRHNSPVERANLDSERNLESSFEAPINCMNTRSLVCEKKFRFSRTPPQWWEWVEKKNLAFGKNFMQSFTQEGWLILSG